MKKLAFIPLLLILISLINGCTTGSGVVLNASELNTTTKMSMTYEKFTGHKQTHIEVKENSPVEVAVNFVTEKGSLDAYIAKDNDTSDCSYEGHDISTSSFTVTLSEPGNYTVRVDAEDHTGSYSFSWGK
jgi:hypothetical protein